MTTGNAVPPHVFHDQRRTALAAQRDATRDRLERLRSEIRKLIARVEAGVIDGDDALREALDKVQRMGFAERRLIDDIQRLDDKIGASHG